MCGVGLLTTPYALQKGGWLSIMLLFVFANISFYTGILLKRCLDSGPGLQTYPDIGQAAFGMKGRIFVSVSSFVIFFSLHFINAALILHFINLQSSIRHVVEFVALSSFILFRI